MNKLIIFCGLLVAISLPTVLGDACTPNPCAANTNCRIVKGTAICSCQRGYRGDAITDGCVKTECSENTDCSTDKACFNGDCVDPCEGTCGPNSACKVEDRGAVCFCPKGFVGTDPIKKGCREMTESDYCNPSPCGTNARCNAGINAAGKKTAICNCPEGYYGNAVENCIKGDCRNNNDCPEDKTCVRSKCVNPCPNGCGKGARCEPKNHISICSCPPNKNGDPFTSCDPCTPNPCAPQTICSRNASGYAVCSCPVGEKFDLKNKECVKAECTLNEDCHENRACLNGNCIDPCKGACGRMAICKVLDHGAVCYCPKGYTSKDPIKKGCRLMTESDYCNPSPCGKNANCKPGFGRSGYRTSVCSCPDGYLGDAKVECFKGECRDHDDCEQGSLCRGSQCRDACNGVCGKNAKCELEGRLPYCSCPQGTTGDPIQFCASIVQ